MTNHAFKALSCCSLELDQCAVVAKHADPSLNSAEWLLLKKTSLQGFILPKIILTFCDSKKKSLKNKHCRKRKTSFSLFPQCSDKLGDKPYIKKKFVKTEVKIRIEECF